MYECETATHYCRATKKHHESEIDLCRNFLAAGYSAAELLADETFLELERRETQLIAERNAIFYEEVSHN